MKFKTFIENTWVKDDTDMSEYVVDYLIECLDGYKKNEKISVMKKKICDQIQENFKNFYGGNLDKLKRYKSVLEAMSHLIEHLLLRGYKVICSDEQIPSGYTNYGNCHEKCITDKLFTHDTVFKMITSGYEDAESSYSLFIYIPFFYDFNDDKWKVRYAWKYTDFNYKDEEEKKA